jgi:hypothetical protein
MAYSLAFISFFLAVRGIAVAGLFFHRARVMDTVLHNTILLAHWTYPQEMVQENVDCESRDFRERNKAMFIMIGGVLVAVALFFSSLLRTMAVGPASSFSRSPCS